MKRKDTITLEVLLADTSFINWAKNQNKNDVSYWNSWIAKNPNHLEVVFNARDIIKGIPFSENILTEEDIATAFDKVMERTGTHVIDSKKTSKRLTPKWIKYAAMLLVLLIPLGYLLFNASDTVTHKTAFGEIIDLTLPDGSQVVLNGNSEISYHKDNPRDIVLNGQASFKVEKKPSTKAKFWVKTPDLKIEVLGTEFNVSTLNDKTDIILDEGSVKLLLNNGEAKQMVPGDLVSYNTNKEEVLHEQVKSETKYISWKEGSYVFNNVSLGEVMKYIAYNYGLSYEFKDSSIENYPISGGIPNGNLEICLLAIQKSSGTIINRFDNKLIINK